MNVLVSPEIAQRGPARVAILGFDGVDELDLFGVYSILSKAPSNRVSEVNVWSRTGSIMATGGIELQTRIIDASLEECDILVVPGGSGALETAKAGHLSDAIAQAYGRDNRIYCCCSGALIVASALNLKEGRMAIHTRKQNDLKDFFSGQIVSGIADSGGIFTIGGRSSESVKSVTLAFRVLNDLDEALPVHVAERTEISWRSPDVYA